MKATHGVLILSALAGIALFMPSCTYPRFYPTAYTDAGLSPDYEIPYYGGPYGVGYGHYGKYFSDYDRCNRIGYFSVYSGGPIYHGYYGGPAGTRGY